MLKIISTLPKNCLIINYLSTKSIKHCENEHQTNFETIYKNRYIRSISLINRIKIHCTILAGVAIPGSFILNEFDIIKSDAIAFTSFLGLSSCFTLYSLGYLTNKFVGFIYINENTNVVKFAYVDFWGRRKELETPVNNIVPFSESPRRLFDTLYLRIKQFSNDDTLKINLTIGSILDKKKFNKIFI